MPQGSSIGVLWTIGANLDTQKYKERRDWSSRSLRERIFQINRGS